MLIIHDEQLAEQLEAIATQENRPIEDVIKSLLSQYAEPTARSSLDYERENASQWLAAYIEELAFETDAPIDPEEVELLLDL